MKLIDLQIIILLLVQIKDVRKSIVVSNVTNFWKKLTIAVGHDLKKSYLTGFFYEFFICLKNWKVRETEIPNYKKKFPSNSNFDYS